MANPTYSTQNIQSNILALESHADYGFCRQAATASINADLVTYPIDNSTGELQLGSVVYFDTDKWVPYTKGEITTGDALGTATAIVIGTDELGRAMGDQDPSDGSPDVFPTGNVGGMLLVNGMAIVRGKYLSGTGGGSTPTFEAVKALIESAMVLVKVYESQDPFDGSYGDETSISN